MKRLLFFVGVIGLVFLVDSAPGNNQDTIKVHMCDKVDAKHPISDGEICFFVGKCAQENTRTRKKWVGVRYIVCDLLENEKCPEVTDCLKKGASWKYTESVKESEALSKLSDEFRKTMKRVLDSHTVESNVWGPTNPKPSR